MHGLLFVESQYAKCRLLVKAYEIKAMLFDKI